MLQALPQDQHKAGLDNPLWTSDPKRIISYGFGISVFFLAILYGFFTSFFIDSYPWQFTGLIIVTAAFLAFTAMGDQF
jgi:threonine/homoserine/homoserine lactone efflux protein